MDHEFEDIELEHHYPWRSGCLTPSGDCARTKSQTVIGFLRVAGMPCGMMPPIGSEGSNEMTANGSGSVVLMRL